MDHGGSRCWAIQPRLGFVPESQSCQRRGDWDNAATTVDAGAATWGNGATGISDPVSPANSLHGSTANDQVSSFGVTALTNGNQLAPKQAADVPCALAAGQPVLPDTAVEAAAASGLEHLLHVATLHASRG